MAMDPALQQYLMLPEEERRRLTEQKQRGQLMAGLGQAAETIGSAFATGAGAQVQADPKFYERIAEQAGAPLAEAEEQRERQLQTLAMIRSQQREDESLDIARRRMALAEAGPKLKSEDDPGSEASRKARAMYAGVYEKAGIPLPPNATANEVLRGLTDARSAIKLAKRTEPKTYEDKVAGLKAEGKKRFDSAAMGIESVKDMQKALAKDVNTFEIIGENEFTLAAAKWEEALGRMQSGGAINAEEAERFRNMVPTWRDDKKTQQLKLKKAYAEMGARLKTLGFTPDEVLAERGKLPQLKQETKPEEGTAYAAGPDPTIQKYAKDNNVTYAAAKRHLEKKHGYKEKLPGGP